jgi:hypothetical protein
MKIESLREVKAKLSKIVKELPSEKSFVITKNGRPCGGFSRDRRNGPQKHVARPAKSFWQLRTRKERKRASPDLKIFRTDARSRLGKFLTVAKDLLPLACHVK